MAEKRVAPPPLRGSCLCGGVRYAAAPPLRDVLECHCHRCQRTSGNFVAATAAPESSITFDAEATLRWYRPADDPNVAYGFCAECGSSLFFRVVDEPSISIMAGTLDGPTGLRTREVWFSANAADHVALDPQPAHFPGQPPSVR
jgi:hypothetical protein